MFSVSQIEELGFSHFYKKQKELFEALEAYPVKAGELFRCAFNHRCKYAELAPADFSSAGVPGHNHLSKQGSEPFRA